jgi:nucleotide-binding universal stress UspA family protein
MAYKTIFTAMTEFDGNSPVLAQAIALAETEDAHLEIMCLGLDRSGTNYYEVGANAMILQAAIEETNAKAQAVHDAVTAFMESTNLRWNAVKTIATTGGVTQTVANEARFSDIGIVALPYAKDHKSEDSIVLEAMLFDAACPTLVTPKGCSTAAPETIVIGWNESAEALRAIRAALPLLKRAKTVNIAIIDPPDISPSRSDPGGALAVFLSRHGIGSQINVMSRDGERVSERLSRHIMELGGDMLVMGGYGHSRFREAILGGATREMLENSKVPVFMAH